jgi:site-specific recombinase XerD
MRLETVRIIGRVLVLIDGLRPEEDIMMERCFKSPWSLRRHAVGLAGPFLDGFAEALFAERYSLDSCGRYLRTASHLGDWCSRRGIALSDLDEGVLARFARHLPKCHCHACPNSGFKKAPPQARRFLQYLRETGVVSSLAPRAPRAAVVTELETWMHNQGLAQTTILQTVRVVLALIDALGEEPARFDAVALRDFVLSYVRQHAQSSAGTVATNIRRFLRYLIARGRCRTDLVEAVPRVPTWRMTRLPQYLPADDVERIVAASDLQQGTALRNRAMLLLARLGLRGHEVVKLRLDDIDWSHARLRVCGKGGRETRLPLPQDVGDAIVRYLRARPTAASDFVFVTSEAPIAPISASGLRDVVGRAIRRAGVRSPSHGTHILRHSLASRLLRQGASLDAIGAVLRHRSIDTTALYAKVDVDLLRQVAQPWPDAEGSPC